MMMTTLGLIHNMVDVRVFNDWDMHYKKKYLY